MSIFLPCSAAGKGEAGIVGLCMLRVVVPKSAPGGVYEPSVTASVKGVSPIWIGVSVLVLPDTDGLDDIYEIDEGSGDGRGDAPRLSLIRQPRRSAEDRHI